jgi:F-type H+-transporting ATPase subunit delta
MADKYTVGQIYGKALFEVAAEANTTDTTYQEVLELQKVATSCPEAFVIMGENSVDADIRAKLVATVFDNFSQTIKNFAHVMNDNARLGYIEFALTDFVKRYLASESIANGTVTTAVEIDATQLEAIQGKVAGILNVKEAKLENVVDPSIIGGVVVKADGNIIDGSIKTKMMRIRKAILTK